MTIPTPSNIPTLQRSILVDAIKCRPRKIGRQDSAVVLPRARTAHRPPLTHPDAVPRPRAGGDESADLPALLGHRELERGAAERPVGLGPEHGAYVGPADAHVAPLEHDPQLGDAPGARRARHLHVGNRLQPVTADRVHRGERPREYSAQLLAVPLFAPAETRRDVAVVVSLPVRIG